MKHAGKEIAQDNKSIRGELTEQAKLTPEFGEAARNKAKRIAIRQEIATLIYKPITNLLGISNKYFDSEFDNDMATKLASIPEEHIVAPKPSLAAPAMQQLGFSLDEPNLRELYLNLLATASDKRIKDSVHPSFVEVIKQLSSDELKLLEDVITTPGNAKAIVQFKYVTEGEDGWRPAQTHVVEATPVWASAIASGYVPTYVDNWVRLGLATVSYTNFVLEPNAYDWVDASDVKEALTRAQANNPSLTLDFDKGHIRPTDFAKSFGAAVGILSPPAKA